MQYSQYIRKNENFNPILQRGGNQGAAMGLSILITIILYALANVFFKIGS